MPPLLRKPLRPLIRRLMPPLSRRLLRPLRRRRPPPTPTAMSPKAPAMAAPAAAHGRDCHSSTFRLNVTRVSWDTLSGVSSSTRMSRAKAAQDEVRSGRV